MTKNYLLGVFGMLLPPALFAQNLAFTHANVIDGTSNTIRQNVTVVVQDGKITGIGSIAAPAGSTIYDLKGRYLMPGLIDAHVHINNFTDAKRALQSGVTTVRSMGVANFSDVGMRALAAKGKIESPEILAAGYHVRHEPDPAFFMNHPELADLMSGVKKEEDIRKMAEAIASHKVDWIKVNATARAGLADTDPRQPYYNESQLKTLVETGAKYGIPIAAHAHGEEGASAAVEAGVRSIEHGTYLSEATLKRMVEKGTYLVPTMAVVSDLTLPGGDYDDPVLAIRGRHMLPRIRETVKKAHELGVKIVAATDTGYGPKGTLRLSQEMEELAAAGMSNLEVIRTATSVAAEMLNIGNRVGKVAQGWEADFLILERNPLDNIGAIHDPLMVVNNGKVVVNRLVW